MRILLVAGLNDLIKDGTKNTVMENNLQLNKIIVAKNSYHSGERNQFAVAGILNPPKLAWQKDNHALTHGYTNRLEELMQNLGVRKTKILYEDGS